MSYASEHAGGIGCGELSAILGLDPRTRPIDVWAVKRGLVEPEDAEDETTARGNEEEEGCIAWAEKRIGSKLWRQPFAEPLARGRLLGRPDAMNGAFGVEAKTRQYSHGWGEDGSSDIPVAERVQVEGYIALTDAPYWYVSVLFGLPLERRLYRIERNEARSAALLARVEAWWQKHIVDGEPPAVADTERSRLARLLHPKAGGEILKCDAPEVVRVMLERKEAEEQREIAQAALEAAENRWRAAGGAIENLIGNALGIETPVGSAILKTRTSRGRLTTKWKDDNDD